MSVFGVSVVGVASLAGLGALLLRRLRRHQRAMEDLREKAARYRAILDGFDGLINMSSSEFRVEFTNKALARRGGRDPVGQTCYEALYGLTAPCRWCRMDAIQRGETIRREMCDPLTGRWYYAVDTPVHHPDGRISKQTVAVDITERKKAEEALKESEEKFRTLVDNVNVGVFRATAGKGARFLQVNPALAKILGYPSGSSLMEVEVVDLFQDRREAEVLVEELRERGVVRGRETSLKKADGATLLASVTATYHRDAQGGVGWADGIVEDVTERKHLEAEILKAQKLESMGLLAGGIAHDFNNLLAAILGNISIARDLAPDGSALCEALADAEVASHRARELTRRLLTFAKGGAPMKRAVAVGDLLASCTRLALSGSKAACQIDVPGDLWPIDADEAQMSQVLTNLVLNAGQAMPDGGTITIRCRNVLTESRAPLADGRHVEIVVRDQGTGIRPEDLGKIFDPFFTSKAKGRGLGLSTAYSIVKQHGGSITVDSTPGAGSTFNILLPAALSPAEVRPGGERSVVGGKGRILVMDDEEGIRRVLTRMLARLGYEVECVSDGRLATEAYARSLRAGGPFDAVIMDLTVPGGMGGKDAVRRLLEIDPQVKAIVSSGYSDDPIMSDFRSFGFAGVISKPYELEDVGAALREALGGRGEGPTEPHLAAPRRSDRVVG